MLNKLKTFTSLLIHQVKILLVTVLLFLSYFLVFGLTALFVRFFKRELLVRVSKDAVSNWTVAEGYDGDEDYSRQA